MKVMDIVAVVGQYKDKNGQDKDKWMTIGACFIKEDGRMSIKMDVVPCGWNGNAIISERKPKEQQAPQQQPQQQSSGELPF